MKRPYTGPTPLHELPRLSAHLGTRVLVKREDLTALGGGGNKVRKLERLVAEALERGATTLITAGSVQSNHCRLTAAAAARDGLACRLVLEAPAPDTYEVPSSGNRLLYDVLGVEAIRMVAPGGLDAGLAEAAREVEASGGVPYVIPVGGSNALGASAYVDVADELLGQLGALGVRTPDVVCASSSGGTCAGLIVGCGDRARVHPICVQPTARLQRDRLAPLAAQVAALVGRRAPEAIDPVDDWVGPAYAHLTPAVREAVSLVARLEGLLLDPVYTGYAMAGLLGLAARGAFGGPRPDGAVVFVHTGGLPALFAYPSGWERAGFH